MKIRFLSPITLAFSLCLITFCVSAQPSPTAKIKSHSPAKARPAGERLILAVSEGASGSIDPLEAINKYRPLADVLEKAAGQRIIITLVRNFEALEQGMKKSEFDLVMARPGDYPGRGVRDYGYSLVATSKPARCTAD